MLARLPAADEPTEQADALRNLIRERCERDRWSDDATRCLTAMKQLEDAEPCARLLTEDQQAALVRDQEARFGAQPGGGAGSGASAGSAAPAAPPQP
jgi:CDP-diacylglycerol pyrophosphatase